MALLLLMSPSDHWTTRCGDLLNMSTMCIQRWVERPNHEAVCLACSR